MLALLVNKCKLLGKSLTAHNFNFVVNHHFRKTTIHLNLSEKNNN